MRIVKLFLIISVIYSFPGLSQQKLIEKLLEIKTEKLVEKMELDDKTADEFRLRFKKFVFKMSEFRKERRKIMKELKDNVETGSGADTLISKLISIDDSIHTHRKDFMENISGILSSKQIAKMLVYEAKFEMELKDKLKEIRKRRKEEKNKP
ncbi:MAG: hypothetical protein N2510_06755 [Ignavibacteria bacterium]|nr:hypothetical protein [Ignavibacteria bacterium]